MRRFHLVTGIIGTIVGLFLTIYFSDIFLIFLLGALLFWFSNANLVAGFFAPQEYLFLLGVPKNSLSDSDKKKIDRIAGRLNSIEHWLFFSIIGTIILFQFFVK